MKHSPATNIMNAIAVWHNGVHNVCQRQMLHFAIAKLHMCDAHTYLISEEINFIAYGVCTSPPPETFGFFLPRSGRLAVDEVVHNDCFTIYTSSVTCDCITCDSFSSRRSHYRYLYYKKEHTFQLNFQILSCLFMLLLNVLINPLYSKSARFIVRTAHILIKNTSIPLSEKDNSPHKNEIDE